MPHPTIVKECILYFRDSHRALLVAACLLTTAGQQALLMSFYLFELLMQTIGNKPYSTSIGHLIFSLKQMLILKDNISIDTASLTIPGAGFQLRLLAYEDVTAIYEAFTPDVTRYMVPGHARCIEDTADFISAVHRNMAAGTEYVFVIEDDARDFCGLIGVHGRSKKYQPELGIWLATSARGRGLGLSAIATVMTWAKAHFVIKGFIYPVDRRNFASRRIPVFYGGKIIEQKIVTTLDTGRYLDEVIYQIPI